MTNERYQVVYHAHGGCSLTHASDGCRQYECCGGSECGLTFDQAKEQIADHYENIAGQWRDVTEENFRKELIKP